MISYVIYFFVFVILSFVIYLAAKAVKRGLDAKNVNKNFNDDFEKDVEKNNKNGWFYKSIKRNKKIFDNGTVNEEEFKKVKKKLFDT